MRSVTRQALVSLLVLVCTAGELPSQQSIQLPVGGSCPQCRVAFQRIATLGTGIDDGYLTANPLWASMDGIGRIYVGLQPPGDLLLMFDTTGHFIGRLGRKGTGPAEFTFPVRAVPKANGELLVWDFQLGMLTTLDSRHRYVRQFHQASPPAAVLRDGRQLVATSMQDRDGVGYTLHIYDDSGRRVTSFASASRFASSDSWRMRRTVAVGPSGSIWSAHTDQYRIEEWTSDLNQGRVFSRSVSWMPRVAAPSDGVTGEQPHAYIIAIVEDDSRRLWVYSRVPSENWKEALGPPRRRPGRPEAYPNRDRGRLFDTMVDVIDLRSNALLLSQRLGSHVRFILRHDLVASYREDANATPLLDIARVQLVIPTRRDSQ